MSQTRDDSYKLLDSAEAAAALRVSKSTLQRPCEKWQATSLDGIERAKPLLLGVRFAALYPRRKLLRMAANDSTQKQQLSQQNAAQLAAQTAQNSTLKQVNSQSFALFGAVPKAFSPADVRCTQFSSTGSERTAIQRSGKPAACSACRLVETTGLRGYPVLV